jgi:hypothetical protein
MDMKKYRNQLALVVILAVGTLVGMVKGGEARQKFVQRFKNRQAPKSNLTVAYKESKSGPVELDDIELAAYHQ